MPPKAAAPELRKSSSSLLPEYTNTPARRHTFFCYCVQNYRSDAAIYWLLVQQYRTDRKRTQAQLIKEWFLDGRIPQILDAGGFITRANIASTVMGPVTAIVDTHLRREEFTSGGFFSSLQQKISGEPKLPADLFDETLASLMQGFNDLKLTPSDGYQPDGKYQYPGTFASPIQALSAYITLAGFDPERAGIY